MKKLVVCVSAWLALGVSAVFAEEMQAPPAVFITSKVPYLAWSGFYIGANAGYGWGDSSFNPTPNDPAAQAGTCGGVGHGTCLISTDFQLHGPYAGGQAGFNWQLSSLWLVGIEADYQWSGIKASTASPTFHLGNVGNDAALANQSIPSFGTLRARMGVIISPPLLFYGTAGLAIVQLSEQVSVANPLAAGSGSVSSGGFSYLCTAGGPSCFVGSSSKTMIGWSGGLGIEYAVTPHLTFKTELLFTQVGSTQVNVIAPSAVAGTTPSSFTAAFPAADVVSVRGGFNFKF